MMASWKRQKCVRISILILIVLMFWGYVTQTNYTFHPHITYITHSAQQCAEQDNTVFIKVHKCGSTTVSSIFFRRAFKRHLSVALPGEYNGVWLGWPSRFDKQHVMKPYRYSQRHEDYNVIAHHAVYTSDTMDSFMPPDTRYLAILREPFQLFKSAFKYFEVATRLKISKTEKFPIDAMTEFFRHPLKYEKPHKYNKGVYSLTRNLISHDMGLRRELQGNETAVRDYIVDIDKKFTLVLILEYLDESLVLMRRLLCWTFRDVIYLSQNVASTKPKNTTPDGTHLYRERQLAEIRRSHADWSKADYMFYDYFNRTLWMTIKKQGYDFWDEVKHLKKVVDLVGRYCSEKEDRGRILAFERTDWYDTFHVTHKDCSLMRMTDIQFTKMFKRFYHDK